MAYRTVLLDNDDTLMDFSKAERAAIAAVIQRLGLRAPGAAEAYSRINAALWRALERGETTPEALRRERFVRFLHAYGLPQDPDEVGLWYIQALAEGCFLRPEALGLLQTLRRRGCRVAIVTNGFSVIQRRRLRLAGVLPYVQAVIVSEEVGAPKPAPALVFAALEALGEDDPGRALLVGDSLTSDMAAARNAGVAGCWFNPTRKPRPEGFRGYETTRLSAVAWLAHGDDTK